MQQILLKTVLESESNYTWVDQQISNVLGCLGFVSFKGSIGVLVTSPTLLSWGSFSVLVRVGHFEVTGCF